MDDGKFDGIGTRKVKKLAIFRLKVNVFGMKSQLILKKVDLYYKL